MRLPIIIALLALFPQRGARACTRVGGAASEIQSIETAAKLCKSVYGIYPPENGWVQELQSAPGAIVNTRRIPMLSVDVKDGIGKMTDPWGNSYVYRYPPQKNRGHVGVYSMGADGRSSSDGDDPDDINNWNPDKPWFWYYHFHYDLKPRLYMACWAVTGGLLILLAIYGLKRRGKAEHRHATDG